MVLILVKVYKASNLDTIMFALFQIQEFREESKEICCIGTFTPEIILVLIFSLNFSCIKKRKKEKEKRLN